MKKLKEKLSGKLKKQGGFTLVEMLIVVAIIAILVAVSIPLVGNSMEKARQATDAANERAAKAAAVLAYLGQDTGIITDPFKAGTTYFYDSVNGTLGTDKTKITPYGATTQSHGSSCLCTETTAHTGKIIALTVSSTGVVSMKWENK